MVFVQNNYMEGPVNKTRGQMGPVNAHLTSGPSISTKQTHPK